MAFIKEATFYISSEIDTLDGAGLPEGEREIEKQTAAGFLHDMRDGSFLLTYAVGEGEERVVTDISISREGVLTLKRVGGISSVMVFELGKEYKTVYSIPPYSFDMTLITKRLDIALKGDGGEIRLIYRMNVGGAEKQVKMTIRAVPGEARLGA
jgi:uncharacterized beta-barrel protein YwiB (DUF1934 family)